MDPLDTLIVFNHQSEVVDFIKAQDGETATFRKQILKRGVYNLPPPREKKKMDFNDEIFDKIIEAFEAKAVENVSIIVGTHDEEKTEKIVGRATALEKDEKGLYATLEIGDSDLIEKIETQLSDGKGVVDEVSVALVHDVPNDEGEEYPLVLFHVAVVTHAWFTGMDSFERIAAHLHHNGNKGKVLLLAATSLEEMSQRIRRAFYSQVDVIYDYYIEGIYEDFIVAHNYDDGSFYRYDFEENDVMITFSNKRRVEKEFVEVEVEAKMDVKEILAALKEEGIEVDSIDSLKKAMKPDDKSNVLAKVNALLNPSKDGGDFDATQLLTQVSTLQTSVTKQTEIIEALQTNMVDEKADRAVVELVNAGKVTPAMKEHYVTLFKTNKELFASLTKDLTKIVPIGQEGSNDGTNDNSGGDINATTEAERIVAAYVTSKDKESK